jgi:tetratricopeptide (TPR) repeat protein
MLPLIMLAFGLVLFFRRKLTVRGRELSPRTVRTVGCLLMAPLPLFFILTSCWLFTVIAGQMEDFATPEAMQEAILDDPNIQNTANVLSLVINFGCLAAALWVAFQGRAAGQPEMVGSLDSLGGQPSQRWTLRQAASYSRLTENQLMLLIRAEAIPYHTAVDGYRIDPRALTLWMSMERGATLHNRGDYAAALQAFEQALQLESSLPEAYAWRGLTYLRLNRQQEAIDQFRQALALERDPDERARISEWLSSPLDAPRHITGRNPVAEQVSGDWLAGVDTRRDSTASSGTPTAPGSLGSAGDQYQQDDPDHAEPLRS